jgi:hypothetical protein
MALKNVEEGMRIRHVGRPGTIVKVDPQATGWPAVLKPGIIRVKFDVGDYKGSGMEFPYGFEDCFHPEHSWWKHEHEPFVAEEEA